MRLSRSFSRTTYSWMTSSRRLMGSCHRRGVASLPLPIVTELVLLLGARLSGLARCCLVRESRSSLVLLFFHPQFLFQLFFLSCVFLFSFSLVSLTPTIEWVTCNVLLIPLNEIRAYK
jgi:hypothetical protein